MIKDNTLSLDPLAAIFTCFVTSYYRLLVLGDFGLLPCAALGGFFGVLPSAVVLIWKA
jgi:hypothetical protein|tara:strand:- start:1105 stop:1278 length:174 start_codon:yes stop_codon:yes gene_type:complete